tara:strand:+ start:43 stop:594 length:552 start_codon:yes stop_codon:yes gene_type:complete
MVARKCMKTHNTFNGNLTTQKTEGICIVYKENKSEKLLKRKINDLNYYNWSQLEKIKELEKEVAELKKTQCCKKPKKKPDIFRDDKDKKHPRGENQKNLHKLMQYIHHQSQIFECTHCKQPTSMENTCFTPYCPYHYEKWNKEKKTTMEFNANTVDITKASMKWYVDKYYMGKNAGDCEYMYE